MATSSTNTTTAANPRKPRIKCGQDLVDLLLKAGYSFRLDERDESLEINGRRETDELWALLRTKLRDLGYGSQNLDRAKDAILAYAGTRRFHPVRDYLKGLAYDGGAYIAELANHVQDQHGIFPLYLRAWLIGAVHRVYTGEHHPVLVMDGVQGIGKSQFVKWLCPVSDMYQDSGIAPDAEDHVRRTATIWIWEVSELGSTTRRADREALKAFLSREVVTFRAKYAKCDTVRPALASFIGTVNNSAGILDDPTGSRRFRVTTVNGIDWTYREHCDRDKVWAEAHAAYLAGESWQLDQTNAQRAATINQHYEVENPIEAILSKEYSFDPSMVDDPAWWVASADIIDCVQRHGIRTAKTTMGDIVDVLRSAGCKAKARQVLGRNTRGWGGLRA
jgi:predicted P-loop ATPase